jgi:hypothetical protein
MPKSKVKKKRLFREVSYLKDNYINKNYLKELRSTRIMFCEDNDISFSHLEFLLWAYDKEFWTINYAHSATWSFFSGRMTKSSGPSTMQLTSMGSTRRTSGTESFSHCSVLAWCTSTSTS